MGEKQMTDDEQVLKKRLELEGDEFDDTRLNLILKTFCTWSKKECSPKENEFFLNRILSLLAESETAMKKSHLTYKRILQEKQACKDSIEQTEEKIAVVTKIMADCKENVAALNFYQSEIKQSVEPVIQQIKQYPSVRTSLNKIACIEEDIKELVIKRNKYLEITHGLSKQLHEFEKACGS